MEKLRKEISELETKIEGHKSSLLIEGVDPKGGTFDFRYRMGLTELKDLLDREEKRLLTIIRKVRRKG